jgi:hypothetical protein
VQSKVCASTCRRYGDDVYVHLIPGLGQCPLAKLMLQQLQLCYARKLNDGLSASTVCATQSLRHRALDNAVGMNVISCNIVELGRCGY